MAHPDNSLMADRKLLALPGVKARPFMTSKTCDGRTPAIGNGPHALRAMLSDRP